MTTLLLVTGARDATPRHLPLIRDGLLTAASDRPGPFTLLHGRAPGLDTLAERVARGLGWAVDGIAANWDAPCVDACQPGHRRPHKNRPGDYCPAAGVYRNTLLVQRAVLHLPDVVAVAFPGAKSRGTWDCVRQIRAAGIELPDSNIIRLDQTNPTPSEPTRAGRPNRKVA